MALMGVKYACCVRLHEQGENIGKGTIEIEQNIGVRFISSQKSTAGLPGVS